ncbi:glucose-induced degradation protein 4 homolog isoform X1 [Momordica charantia]|uniref:Glucose-induced degradation protein 4 homolog isoform X1 n=1 Tax=Momordica charantia TaxID=3673 RepID=A0A6J1CS56_MOMCH|nr:glucose-induced degradation protein 4 homolog isoform X1 [Momordica charantia]
MPVRVESSAPSPISSADARQTSPQACTLLSVGQAFSGTQNVSNNQKDEAWRVNVRIQGLDLEHGYLCGTMEALNVPMADTPVVTFWEGEIVDGKNYNFFTGKWQAAPEDDIRHWTKFPSFSPLMSQVEVDGGKSLDLSNYPCIFMRWKEQYFVNVGTDCGLTIAGFYYVCFSCSDGSISGFYYDPNTHFRSLSSNPQMREDRVSASHRTSCDDLNGKFGIPLRLVSLLAICEFPWLPLKVKVRYRDFASTLGDLQRNLMGKAPVYLVLFMKILVPQSYRIEDASHSSCI